MEQEQFIKQLFLNLDINKELLYKAIEDRSLEEKIVIYQFLTGNLPPIPQVVKNNTDDVLVFKNFDPFDYTQISYSKTTERKVYFKTEEDFNKYNGCKSEDIPYDGYQFNKNDRYSFEGTCIYTNWNKMTYKDWIRNNE
jgi:hypothetical protein